MYRSGMGGMDRDFGHNDMPMSRGFGDSFGAMGRQYKSYSVKFGFEWMWFSLLFVFCSSYRVIVSVFALKMLS